MRLTKAFLLMVTYRIFHDNMMIYILHECHVLWQWQYFVMFEGASCRCAQCTGPVMCEEVLSMNLFFRGRRNFW